MGHPDHGVGAWAVQYEGLVHAHPYGGHQSYAIGADWLERCSTVEDWGCGPGWLRTLIDHDRYRGIDGSPTPFADEIVDLAEYRSQTPGLFMRHVLEHDWRWEEILDNAVASFTDRMALVMFAAGRSVTREISRENATDAPVIGFRLADITDRLRNCRFNVLGVPSEQGPGWDSVYDETVILAERI